MRSARHAEEQGVEVDYEAAPATRRTCCWTWPPSATIDLIVVGNKGMTGARRYLLGGVPNKISHHAPCSVMIVRTD